VEIYVSLIAIKAKIDMNHAVFNKFNETSKKLGFRTRLRLWP
jgi:hypothetical protein